ncbi:hypothetical protein [Elizabethkingia occulta]|uniref:hypothetical protein n=1 Tax=Elizabethkingia occulta TaxID=1867263 RepID=UPI0009995276|nr:hypothetical protein [Elizabethkingia occulta]OPB92589.1 hypothetical protein BB020_08280 [Elizabethkingia occulta]
MTLKQLFQSISGLIVLFMILGCRSDSVVNNDTQHKPNVPGVPHIPGHTSKDMLNVIYFLPKGSEPVSGYLNRISNILLDAQKYYGKWMEHWGYGNETFRLNKRGSSIVNIIVINGEKTKDFYVYDIHNDHGVSTQIRTEVLNYFKLHPNEKHGSYNLVILPAITSPTLNGGNAAATHGGVPFYGSNKWCYAVDYQGLDLRNLGKEDAQGKLATYLIGGMLHELGHGLGLYHNIGRSDEKSSFGEGLMGYGALHYGTTYPTYLTSADAAILSVNPTVSTQLRSDWLKDPNFHLPKISVSVNNNGVILSGVFSTDKTVKAITVNFNTILKGGENDPQQEQERQGYGSVGLGKKYINNTGDGRFSIVMPNKALYNNTWLDGEPFRITLRFCHDNGFVTTKMFDINLYRGMNESHIFNHNSYSAKVQDYIMYE